jgi:tetratricopeptide (TPR) repeat protein
LGKSRLIHEFARFIDDRQELVSWRQGRCLPYGDGITFWALGEIVKAQAGILESDPSTQVTAKLDSALQALVGRASDREWLRARLAPLVGLGNAEGPGADQAELFAAWRRVIEAMAASGPLVLVVEDLHWADAALLQFLKSLIDSSAAIALLVIAAARPELLDRHGETRRSRAVLLRAIELLEHERPSPELCSSYAQMAADRVLSGHSEEAPAWADKALALAEQLGGLPEVKVQALDYRGMARCDLGDLGGLDDLRQALELAHQIGAGNDAAVLYISLAEPLWVADGPATALETCQTGIDFSERRGLTRTAMWIRSASFGPLADLGRWDEALILADEVIAQERAHGGGYQSVGAATYKAQILLWRGEITAAQPLVRELLSQARDIDDLQILVPALAAAAAVEAAGNPPLAAHLIEELNRVAQARGGGSGTSGCTSRSWSEPVWQRTSTH